MENQSRLQGALESVQGESGGGEGGVSGAEPSRGDMRYTWGRNIRRRSRRGRGAGGERGGGGEEKRRERMRSIPAVI